MVEMFKIELSRSQIENLVEFIEMNFIDAVKKDVDIDNFRYVVDMCDTFKILENALKRDVDNG